MGRQLISVAEHQRKMDALPLGGKQRDRDPFVPFDTGAENVPTGILCPACDGELIYTGEIKTSYPCFYVCKCDRCGAMLNIGG